MVSQVSLSRIAIYHHNRSDDHRCRCHQQCPTEMMTTGGDIKSSTKLTNSSCNAMCSSPGRGFYSLLFGFYSLLLGFHSFLFGFCPLPLTWFSRLWGFYSFLWGLLPITLQFYSWLWGLWPIILGFSLLLWGFHSFLWGFFSLLLGIKSEIKQIPSLRNSTHHQYGLPHTNNGHLPNSSRGVEYH